MSTTDELIYKKLTTTSTLVTALAKYNTKPAVFADFAATDVDKKWATEKYPHIVYSVNTKDDPARRISGEITIDVICEEDTTVGPEKIDGYVRTALNNTFFETDDAGTISVRWQKTTPFAQNDEIIGTTIIFDVYAYPKQTLPSSPAAPDPVSGLMSWLKTKLGASSAYYLEGSPQSVDTWTPTTNKPAYYIRYDRKIHNIISAGIMRVESPCILHVITPSISDRQSLALQIAEYLAVKGSFTMPNGAPYILMNNISCIVNADPISQGQITVQGFYYANRHDSSGTKVEEIGIRVTKKEE